MRSEDVKKKWDAIYGGEGQAGEAARVLFENSHLLPARGQALEAACGRGANALLLASLGIHTDAWDISAVAIESLQAEAERQDLTIRCEARDIMQQPPGADSYDVIVVSHFLERGLIPLLIKALRPQGLLFYQTFTRSRVSERGPSNPDFRLADNELLELCAGMRVLVYREEGRVGDTGRGFRDLAMIVAQRIDIEDEQRSPATGAVNRAL